MEAEIDDQKYKINIEWVQCISKKDTGDMLAFLKTFFNSLLRRIKFKQIGRSYFNPDQQHTIPHHGIQIWPGFSSSLQAVQRGVLLNIDIVHKVLRTQSVLSILNEVKDRARQDPIEAIKKALIGSTIMTTYNKRTYKVDEVDFNISPRDTFTVEEKEGPKEQSYVDYFKTKYDARINDMN